MGMSSAAGPHKMSKKARVDAALRNEPVDRPAVSLWRHFYECERSAEDLAGAMLAWHKKYDWDWMKVNPRASYHVEGWGLTTDYGAAGTAKPVVTNFPVNSVGDWGRLTVLSPESGVLDEQVEVIERIGESVGGDVYYVETVFSPLSVAADLVSDGKSEILRLMKDEPQALRDGLDIITETFAGFTKACLAAGACGIFFATTDWASRDLLSEEQYAEWGRPYDLRVLAAAQDAAFNVLHVCKNNNLLFALCDYPVHAINWAVGEPGNPELRDVQLNTDKVVIGGWRNETLLTGSAAEVKAQARAAREQTGGKRFILGPGCAIDPATLEENIRAARAAADEVE